MNAFWIVLAVLVAGEALLTLRSAFGFRAFFLREAAHESAAARWPKTAVLAPCKGLDTDLLANIRSWEAQDYPDYSIFFVVQSETDPALNVVRSVKDPRILVAGDSVDCGQKIHNLRFAIDRLPSEYEVLAFVDSDARVRPDWLKSLVARLLADPGGAATGYRWFSDRGAGFAGRLRAAWNSSVLTLYEETGKNNFAWGGSMAILRKTFDETRVMQFWDGSLSDDYALTNALRASGRRVHFVPRAMAFTQDRTTAREFLSWAGRQLLITRLYFPHLWRLAFGFHVIWMLWLVLGAVFLPLWFLPVFVLVQLAQGIKSNVRLQCAEAIFASEAGSRATFWLMSPLVGISNFIMMMGNLLTSRVRWRGVEYEVLGPNKLRRTGV